MLPKTGRRVPGPRYDLEAFQAEVRAGNVHVYRTRASDVIRRLRRCSRDEAVTFAQEAVFSLTPDHYAHTIEQPNGQIQDVYGLMVQDEGWYIKIELYMGSGQPGIASCHPAEYDLRTRGGIVPCAQA